MTPFAQPPDPIDFYGTRFMIAVVILGSALLLYTLARYRGRIRGPLSWALLIAGVLVLPSICTMFGMLLVFERAERVEFCGSCHAAMQNYVNDMMSPASDSLAAVHYRNRYIPRNQCYTCHTSFGMFGTFQAKVAGIVDVQKYYLRRFHPPLKMRVPYRNDDCLKCHSGAVKWSSNHASYRSEVLEGKMRCIDCHSKKNPAHRL